MFTIDNGSIPLIQFLVNLPNDRDFEWGEPMTQAYLEEVGWELGWDLEKIRGVIFTLHSIGLIKEHQY